MTKQPYKSKSDICNKVTPLFETSKQGLMFDVQCAYVRQANQNVYTLFFENVPIFRKGKSTVYKCCIYT